MATYTSAAANKELRRLTDEKERLLSLESQRSTYVLGADEQDEPPAYDYAATRAEVARIDGRVRAIRHALHVFNATYVLPQAQVTIDEALILLAQLTGVKDRLGGMRDRLPRVRIDARLGRVADVVEYRYTNYDVERAGRDYEEVSAQIAALQLEIDLTNQTQTFEVAL